VYPASASEPSRATRTTLGAPRQCKPTQAAPLAFVPAEGTAARCSGVALGAFAQAAVTLRD